METFSPNMMRLLILGVLLWVKDLCLSTYLLSPEILGFSSLAALLFDGIHGSKLCFEFSGCSLGFIGMSHFLGPGGTFF